MRRVIGMGLRGISAVFILSGVAVVGETILAFVGILDQQYVQQFVLDALNDNGLLRRPVSIALPLLCFGVGYVTHHTSRAFLGEINLEKYARQREIEGYEDWRGKLGQ